MKKFIIYYGFSGYGKALVQAESEAEANSIWNNGGVILDEQENGQNYETHEIIEMPNICPDCKKFHTHTICKDGLLP